MTRMTHSLLPLQQRHHPSGNEAQHHLTTVDLADLEPLALGPGWFDSSWELETGLEVCESSVLDPALQSWFEAVARETAAARGPGAAPPSGNRIEFEPLDRRHRQSPAWPAGAATTPTGSQA